MAEKGKRRWFLLGAAAALAAGIVVLACMLSGGEPTLAVTGLVTEAATGAPIAGARVFDDGYGPKPPRGATTDSSGRYRYTTWPEEHNAAAQSPGYKKETRLLMTCIFQAEKEMVMDFALRRE